MEIFIEKQFNPETVKNCHHTLWNHYSSKSVNVFILWIIALIVVYIPIFYDDKNNYLVLIFFLIILGYRIFQFFKVKKEWDESLANELNSTPINSIVYYKIDDDGIIFKNFHFEYFYRWTYFKYFQSIGHYILLLPFKEGYPSLVINRKDFKNDSEKDFIKMITTRLKRKK